jgi:AraC-like DNA-binding protein
LSKQRRASLIIALDFGYSEQPAFTRQFKSTVGIPPGKYRVEFGGWW